MPVGSRSSVCTSACLRSSRLTVSPAPPSKRTLSGTTIAARPCCFRIVKTCWRKLSCLLLVLAQKSSRCTTSDCFSSSPASFTIVTLLFFPKRRIGQDHFVFAVFAGERVFHHHRNVRRIAADPVKHEIHAAESRNAIDQFNAAKLFGV